MMSADVEVLLLGGWSYVSLLVAIPIAIEMSLIRVLEMVK